MAAHVHIRQRYRDEFELTGIEGVRDQIKRGTIDSEKRVQALAWIDEKVHGEQRAFQAEQATSASRAATAAERASAAAERAAAAAEEQARQAQKANRIAATALITAIASIIMSLIALARKIG